MDVNLGGQPPETAKYHNGFHQLHRLQRVETAGQFCYRSLVAGMETLDNRLPLNAGCDGGRYLRPFSGYERRGSLTPLQLETLLGTNLLEVCIGEGF